MLSKSGVFNMNDDILKYKIALGMIPGLGFVTAKNIISYCGSIENFFKATLKDLVKTPGVGEIVARKIIKNRDVLDLAEKEIRFLEKNDIHTNFYLDEDYSYLLKQCPDAPLIIYKKGNLCLRDRKVLSIVGTRNASPQGKEICEDLIKNLSESGHNPVIVSGLAYGIDICAHRAALKYGLDTVAVLAHGFDRIYPQNHRKTASEIKEKGALITEFTTDSKFERQNFLRRNRIIAGLSHATIVIESAKKGGALVTADIANSYDREVFAVPGRLEDTYSEGTNWLIKTHKAFLLQTASDIEYILNWEQGKPDYKQQTLFIELSEDEKRIAEILNADKKPAIDDICKKAGLTMSKVSSLLLDLEFKGAVRSLPGKVYELAGKISFQK